MPVLLFNLRYIFFVSRPLRNWITETNIGCFVPFWDNLPPINIPVQNNIGIICRPSIYLYKVIVSFIWLLSNLIKIVLVIIILAVIV